MIPLRLKIQNACQTQKVAQHVVEKDYALSYVLVGIAKQPELIRSLVFKGGTALKKAFFGDYRFSEDLDFSAFNAPQHQALKKSLKEAVEISKALLSQYGPFDVHLKRNPERAPHPHGKKPLTF